MFALAVAKGWATTNPVEQAARPRRRRAGDPDPDLQFLTLPELDAVIEAIPDSTVDRDAIGPALRVLVLVAAMTGIRQSELLGMRWRDVELRGTANPRPQRVGAWRAFRRRQVRPEYASLGTHVGPRAGGAEEVAAAQRLRRRGRARVRAS